MGPAGPRWSRTSSRGVLLHIAVAFAVIAAASCGSQRSEPLSSVAQEISTETPFGGNNCTGRVGVVCDLGDFSALPCCARYTDRGEHQLFCCVGRPVFDHRLCANGTPSCPGGGTYPGCAGVVCPQYSWACTGASGRPECCNDCGPIGARGCAVCENIQHDGFCRIVNVPGNDVCVGVLRTQGRFTRVILPGGDTAP